MQANIEDFMKNQESADFVLKRMQDNYRCSLFLVSDIEICSKYKFMEMSLSKNKQTLISKLPEIRNTLEMVKTLKDKKV
jgi:hypothetical protein